MPKWFYLPHLPEPCRKRGIWDDALWDNGAPGSGNRWFPPAWSTTAERSSLNLSRGCANARDWWSMTLETQHLTCHSWDFQMLGLQMSRFMQPRLLQYICYFAGSQGMSENFGATRTMVSFRLSMHGELAFKLHFSRWTLLVFGESGQGSMDSFGPRPWGNWSGMVVMHSEQNRSTIFIHFRGSYMQTRHDSPPASGFDSLERWKRSQNWVIP